MPPTRPSRLITNPGPPSVRFEVLRLEEGPLHPFELGDFRLTVNGRSIDSSASPRLAHMIHLSLCDLIEGLLRMADGIDAFVLNGVDSSFRLDIRRRRYGVSVFDEKTRLDDTPLASLIEAVRRGLEAHFRDAPIEDHEAPVIDELLRLRQALNRLD